MTIHTFPKNDMKNLRSQILDMEEITKAMALHSKSLGFSEGFVFELGKTAQAAQAVTFAMRDFIQQIEALEKAAEQNGLNINGDQK